MIHLNSLVLLIVVGVIVAELVMYLRRRVRRAQAGAAQAGTTGGPTSPPGTPPRPGRRVAVVLMAVYIAFFWLSLPIAGLADEYCSSQRCHATVGWASLMLLVTLVLISVTAIAGVLPRRTAGQRIRALVLGFAGPLLALIAYFVAISGQVPL